MNVKPSREATKAAKRSVEITEVVRHTFRRTRLGKGRLEPVLIQRQWQDVPMRMHDYRFGFLQFLSKEKSLLGALFGFGTPVAGQRRIHGSLPMLANEIFEFTIPRGTATIARQCEIIGLAERNRARESFHGQPQALSAKKWSHHSTYIASRESATGVGKYVKTLSASSAIVESKIGSVAEFEKPIKLARARVRSLTGEIVQ
ncbi:hypothetical protein K438DRAFT_1755647 [Mycena galopus ATCC 62051]|nr:hypothetical protein K438DRAFT_1755647 [Mycena galopus ATCC 62051]